MLTPISASRAITGADSRTDDAQLLMAGIFDLGYEKASAAELSWQDFALCAQTDPDIFFPEKGGSTAPATSVCASCPVQADCLEYAITNDIRHGIWGGMSDNDRRKISRERRRSRIQGA